MKKLIYLVALFVFAACSSDHLYDSGEPALQEIQLYTGINTITPKTRGDSIITGTRTAPLDVSFVLIEEEESGYPASYASIDTLNAQIKTDDAVIFETPQYYRPDGRKSKLISWYPRATSITPSDSDKVVWDAVGGTVSFPKIDGSTDILVSDTIEGSKSDPITGSRKVIYNHVLTKITVSVLAEADVISMWGKIDSIKLVGKAQTCKLALPATINAATDSEVTFTGNDDLMLVSTDKPGGVAVSDVTLTTTEEIIGYAMFAPHLAVSDKLEMEISTEKGEGKVTISYSQMELEAGTSYNVKLQFKTTGITSTATITEWDTDDTVVEIPVE